MTELKARESLSVRQQECFSSLTLLLSYGSIRDGVFDGQIESGGVGGGGGGTYYVERINKFLADDGSQEGGGEGMGNRKCFSLQFVHCSTGWFIWSDIRLG